MKRTFALNRILLSGAVFFLSLNGFSSDSILWLRYPSISPDGNTILFNYKGDIYKVPVNGGQAIPLTISESYEYSPVWSHDGKQIAFASDRYGNFDVYVMPATGGEAKRLTFHSSNEVPETFLADNRLVLFSASRQDAVTNVQYPTGMMSELYSVPVTGGRVLQVLSTPALDVSVNSTGTILVYHDIKGYEDNWRKHHVSAVTRDIWSYDLNTGAYHMLSEFEGEDRDPQFSSDDDHFYYLSERNGSFNIYKSSLSDPGNSIAITEFDTHPVRFLSVSNDNRLCFSYDGEIYTMVEGSAPSRLEVFIALDGLENLDKIVSVGSAITEAALAPGGKEFAFVFRGEVFVCSMEGGITKRITSTPWQERSVSFSPDGRSLVYAVEEGNSWNIYTSSIIREEESYFFMSTILKTDTVIATEAEEFQPLFSPDGKEVAYLENRVILKVVNLESKKTRTIMPADKNYSYADGDQYYQWSPDGKWFLVVFGQPENVMSGEVGIVSSGGDSTIHNLTLSGYEDRSPKWMMDGKMMIWGSNRESNRAEGGQLREIDVYAMYFTREAFDRSNLSKEEFDLLKEKEKKEKEDNGEKDENGSGKKEKKEKRTKGEGDKGDTIKLPDPVDIDWDNLAERRKRLTIHTAPISDAILSKDGEKLYYMTRFEKTFDIWETELRTKKTKEFAKIGSERGASMELSKDGKFIFVLAGGKVKKVDAESGKVEDVAIKGEMVLKAAEERAYIFDHAWRQVKRKFYVPDLHGVDWEMYYKEYEKFLPHINNNYDFAEMLSEMLGELNASHTGCRYRFTPPNSDQTASLGVLYDFSYTGNGLKIAEVIIGGPLDKADSKVKAGHIIEKIDGEIIDPAKDYYSLLNRKNDRLTLLSILDPETGKRWDETVKPVSGGEENQLLYERWVRNRRKEVEKLSGGRLGYVHVRSMNDASMRVAFEESLGRYLGAEAIIVDTRFNGGGNIHEQLSDFFTGEKYFDIIPHGQYIGSEPGNKWIKPSIVIMGESNYSDAHIFPLAYKAKNGGKTLGMPVPGTGTFVWWETQIDPTLVFGIPMGGWRGMDGEFAENNQMEPDIKVRNEPGIMSGGRDQQIEAAVKELLRQLDK
ncbi:MAG: PD40 domain-containing protein [Bacteroidales bacterium]|nr:PD40 domain-containing protein [Bacteroidales bacterium]MBN2698395.1 PD40 domain-containing protein [Bacteroidales bacterium]